MIICNKVVGLLFHALALDCGRITKSESDIKTPAEVLLSRGLTIRPRLRHFHSYANLSNNLGALFCWRVYSVCEYYLIISYWSSDGGLCRIKMYIMLSCLRCHLHITKCSPVDGHIVTCSTRCSRVGGEIPPLRGSAPRETRYNQDTASLKIVGAC